MLQKQCQDYDRRLEKLSNALEKEQDLTGNLKDILNEEKMRVNKLKDDLDRESENVSNIIELKFNRYEKISGILLYENFVVILISRFEQKYEFRGILISWSKEK